MHAQRNVSNSSGAIPNINTTRILEKEANWRPKNDHTHSLIPLYTYLYVFMPHGMQGSEKPRDQRNLSRPSRALPPTGRRRGRVWLRETNPTPRGTWVLLGSHFFLLVNASRRVRTMHRFVWNTNDEQMVACRIGSRCSRQRPLTSTDVIEPRPLKRSILECLGAVSRINAISAAYRLLLPFPPLYQLITVLVPMSLWSFSISCEHWNRPFSRQQSSKEMSCKLCIYKYIYVFFSCITSWNTVSQLNLTLNKQRLARLVGPVRFDSARLYNDRALSKLASGPLLQLNGSPSPSDEY